MPVPDRPEFRGFMEVLGEARDSALLDTGLGIILASFKGGEGGVIAAHGKHDSIIVFKHVGEPSVFRITEGDKQFRTGAALFLAAQLEEHVRKFARDKETGLFDLCPFCMKRFRTFEEEQTHVCRDMLNWQTQKFNTALFGKLRPGETKTKD